MKEIDWSECKTVWSDPARLGGQLCFTQTRLPIRFLFENLAEGVSLEDFCDWYPPVTKQQCREVLAFVGHELGSPRSDFRAAPSALKAA
jgi:uncharacterized protein (DUF433 family)